MTKIDIEEIKKRSDYALALKGEIELDIKRLSDYVWAPNWNNLNDINKKIDLARTYWINVESLDKQILEFRIILFKKRVAYKIEEVNESNSKLAFNIDTIELEYSDLKKEININLEELQSLMYDLYNEVIKSKIKFMLNDIDKDPNTTYSMEQVVYELDLAKERWVNVDDIKEMLFG